MKIVACEINEVAVILCCITFCRDNELRDGTLQIGGPQPDVQKEDILALKTTELLMDQGSSSAGNLMPDIVSLA